MLLQGVVVVFALRYGIVAAGDTRWTTLMDLVRVECGEPGVNQDEIPFVGFKDECDNEDIAPYTPANSAAHLDFVIDPRNADDIQVAPRTLAPWTTGGSDRFLPFGSGTRHAISAMGRTGRTPTSPGTSPAASQTYGRASTTRTITTSSTAPWSTSTRRTASRSTTCPTSSAACTTIGPWQ